MAGNKPPTKLYQRQAQLARARWGSYPERSSHADALLRIIGGAVTGDEREMLMEACLTMLPPESGRGTTADLPRGTNMPREQWDKAWEVVRERMKAFLGEVKSRNDSPRTVAERVLGFLASLSDDNARTVAFAYLINPSNGLVPYVQIEARYLAPFPGDIEVVAARHGVVRSARILQRLMDQSNVTTDLLIRAVCRTLLTHIERPVEMFVIAHDFVARLMQRSRVSHGGAGNVVAFSGVSGLADLLERLGVPPEVLAALHEHDAVQPDSAGDDQYGDLPKEVVAFFRRMEITPAMLAVGSMCEQVLAAIRTHTCGDPSCPITGATRALAQYEDTKAGRPSGEQKHPLRN